MPRFSSTGLWVSRPRIVIHCSVPLRVTFSKLAMLFGNGRPSASAIGGVAANRCEATTAITATSTSPPKPVVLASGRRERRNQKANARSPSSSRIQTQAGTAVLTGSSSTGTNNSRNSSTPSSHKPTMPSRRIAGRPPRSRSTSASVSTSDIL